MAWHDADRRHRQRGTLELLQKPDLADERLIERVQEEYGLRFAQVTFLELGGDLGTAVYQATTDGGTAYFCKLRRGADDTAAQVASFLHGQGVPQIIPPLMTVSAQPSTGLDGFTLTLYPFVKGMSGYDVELSAPQWADLAPRFNGSTRWCHHPLSRGGWQRSSIRPNGAPDAQS